MPTSRQPNGDANNKRGEGVRSAPPKVRRIITVAFLLLLIVALLFSIYFYIASEAAKGGM